VAYWQGPSVILPVNYLAQQVRTDWHFISGASCQGERRITIKGFIITSVFYPFHYFSWDMLLPQTCCTTVNYGAQRNLFRLAIIKLAAVIWDACRQCFFNEFGVFKQNIHGCFIITAFLLFNSSLLHRFVHAALLSDVSWGDATLKANGLLYSAAVNTCQKLKQMGNPELKTRTESTSLNRTTPEIAKIAYVTDLNTCIKFCNYLSSPHHKKRVNAGQISSFPFLPYINLAYL
jgi:hypothetical protein